MDAKVDDWVVTPRRGKAVEINALWYNALRLLGRWMRASRRSRHAPTDSRRARSGPRPRSTGASGTRRPATCSTSSTASTATTGVPAQSDAGDLAAAPGARPAALGGRCCGWSTQRLLTPVGLRSLSPDHPDYKARYFGDLRARDAAYHQGTVWTWLLGPFVDAWLAPYPSDVAAARRARVERCLEHLGDACVGSVSEIFDAEPPFSPRGCIAQAWSVAEAAARAGADFAT